MKHTFLLLTTFCISIVSFSQETEEIDRTGNVIIDLAIGVPNAGSALLTSGSMFDFYNVNDITKNTSLPVQLGGRFEYMLNNKIGMGLEGNYEKAGWERTYKGGGSYNPSTGLYGDTITSFTQTKTRFLVRFAFHPVQTKRVDMFLGAGLGMTLRKYEHQENKPDTWDSFFFPIYLVSEGAQPLAARFFFGTRILMTENIGMLVEVGLGSGSILDLGLSVRF
jgi:hypothetical protein